MNRARVRYILVGGYASVLHGVPRTTLDIDVVLDPEPRNVGRAIRALRGVGLHPETDRLDEILAQGGVTAANNRTVDLLTATKGRSFDDLWSRRVTIRYPLPCGADPGRVPGGPDPSAPGRGPSPGHRGRQGPQIARGRPGRGRSALTVDARWAVDPPGSPLTRRAASPRTRGT
jgi:hypothetical protein